VFPFSVFSAAENSIGVMGFSISIALLLGMYDRMCVLLSDVCFWCMNVMVKFVSDEISEKFLQNKCAISSLWVVF